MKIRFHYHRSDQNYAPWSLWVWPADYSGRAVKFTDEDDYGKIAVVEFPGRHDKVGFVVRSSAWDKDIEFDRYIEEFIDGDAEVWLRAGDPQVYTVPPAELRTDIRALEEVELTVHYYRYDHNYEGWNLWMWDGDSLGREVTFVTEDDYGLVGRVVFQQQTDAGSIGFVIRKSVSGNEWFAKDIKWDRQIPLYRTDHDGKLHVWLMQDDPRIYFSPNDVERTPSIKKALIDEERLMSVEVNIPLSLSDERGNGFKLFKEGEELEIEDVVARCDFSKGIRKVLLIPQDPLDLEKTYRVKHVTHGSAVVGFGRIFDSPAFEKLFHYPGDDLGARWTPTKTTFRVWTPTALAVNLITYEHGTGGIGQEHPMEKDVHGTWVTTLEGDLHGTYYVYKVTHIGFTEEVMDPYAFASGVNGERAMVVDFSRTDPLGWDNVKKPSLESFADAIIYEMHVRDFSIHPASGIEHKGKYLGVIEPNTTGQQGVSTGFNHLRELGVTHVHLMPVFDFATVDETNPSAMYNWGYDPQNYNLPEGSYSTDPYHGEVRIKEFKQMIHGLHSRGINVVMDVVYNHTARSTDSHLNKLVPGYYYRLRPDGSFSNGSGCGNELADERSMVRKMIVDSVRFWASEYKIGGFRFDLMGLHHIDTMKAVRRALDQIDPTILIYGEGWTGGPSTLPSSVRAEKDNTPQLKRVASFCNDMRDGIKGHVFHSSIPGFVQGGGAEETVKFGIVGAIHHPQIDYGHVMYSSRPWALEPTQAVNYAASHDNLTLWDKLKATSGGEEKSDRIKMHKLANAIILTSQGIPFLHAGQEFARTKSGDHNSYRSPDAINRIDWGRKVRYREIFDYTRGLIALRKAHPAFRMTLTRDVQAKLTFLPMPKPHMVGYTLGPYANDDPWRMIVVLFNANPFLQKVDLGEDGWVAVVDGNYAGVSPLWEIQGRNVVVDARSCFVLVDRDSL